MDERDAIADIDDDEVNEEEEGDGEDGGWKRALRTQSGTADVPTAASLRWGETCYACVGS